MSRLVKRTSSSNGLTAKRKLELAELAGRPDSEIDFSDIPELTEDFWKNAVRNPFNSSLKSPREAKPKST
jgi:hypothetical protein